MCLMRCEVCRKKKDISKGVYDSEAAFVCHKCLKEIEEEERENQNGKV